MNHDEQNRMLAIFKSLANMNRIKILKLIHSTKNGALGVNEIADKMEISQPAISDHLKIMRLNKVFRAKQTGSNMIYSIREPLVAELLNRMK